MVLMDSVSGRVMVRCRMPGTPVSSAVWGRERPQSRAGPPRGQRGGRAGGGGGGSQDLPLPPSPKSTLVSLTGRRPSRSQRPGVRRGGPGGGGGGWGGGGGPRRGGRVGAAAPSRPIATSALA